MLSPQDLDAALGGAPGQINGPNTELYWCHDSNGRLSWEHNGHLAVTLRLVCYDMFGGKRTISNIKEQQCCLVFRENRSDEPERVAAYVAAWRAVVADILAHQPADALEAWMPHDLTSPKVLSLKTPMTVEDFSARLRARSRLGKLLG